MTPLPLVADYSQAVTADQLDAALRAVGAQAVMHYLGGDFARRLELPSVVAEIRRRGWAQGGIFVPHLASVDGQADADCARTVYGFGAGARLVLDIEPEEFRADPRGWAAAADRWCPAVRAAGYLPGVYGVDDTLASCANHADWIWRAVPGECDPAGPGLAAGFFGGARMVQCRAGVWAGVEMDVSLAQFDLRAAAPAPAPSRRRSDVITTERPDHTGTDYFVAMPNGVMRHLVLLTDGSDPYDDVVPGTWSAPVKATWAPDMSSLQLLGLSVDGTAWTSTWSRDSGTWGQPLGQVGTPS